MVLFAPLARAQGTPGTPPSQSKSPGYGGKLTRSSAPALLKADRVSYDQDLGIVVASGHVQISQNERVLLADTVTYNQRVDLVTASGNVSLLQPDGDVVFASYMELSEGLKQGAIQDFRLLLSDHARMAATGARLGGNGNLTEMANGVYSLCAPCKKDPTRAPLWQVEARDITHDDTDHEIRFEDATMEMFGVPVGWTPYFQFPDPTVKRKSGFLMPTYGVSTQLGTLIQVPYFQTLGPDKDVLLNPIFTTKGGQVFDGEYRERWGDAALDVQGSLTGASSPLDSHQDSIGGNVNARGIVDINDNWRAGFDAYRETTQTYIAYYKLLTAPSSTLLTSRAYAEGFFGRSYNSLDAYAFQDLRTTVPTDTLPVIAPSYQFNYVSEPGSHGQRWTVDASALNLSTPVGVDSRRLSQRTQWDLPYTASDGQMYDLALSFETDGYSTSDNINPNNPTALRTDTSAGRMLPQIKLDWRYPWVRQAGTVEELIEPHVAFIGGPQGRNSFLIPNQDSLAFELDDTNMYNLNPFPGVDRVDGGERVIYGTSIGAYGSKGGTANMFFGQLYRPHTDDTFTTYSGLSGHQSDYVGHVQIKPLKDVDVTYRYLLSPTDFSPRSTLVSATLGPSGYTLSANYLSVTQQVPGVGIQGVQEGQFTPNVKITDHWSATSGTVYNFTVGRLSSISASAIYDDECFNMTAVLSRSYTQSGPVMPSTSILVTLIFKSFTTIPIGGSLNNSNSNNQ